MGPELCRDKCCCFTGHRRISPQENEQLRGAVGETVLRLCEEGYDTFIAGGAIGFDTLVAQEVLKLRESHSRDIRLLLALPCLDQDRLWSDIQRRQYDEIRKRADIVVYTGKMYTKGCMLARDRYMVDNSSCCVCFLREPGPRSGTAYTVRYAKSRRLRVINLAKGGQQTL